MYFTDSYFDEFDERNEIAEEAIIKAISGGYSKTVKLRSSGNLYILCPFHGEKTASFVYYTQTKTWYCYGCHMRGSVPDRPIGLPLLGQLSFEFYSEMSVKS